MESTTLPSVLNLLYIEDDSSIVDLITAQLNSTRHTKFHVISRRTLEEGLEYLDEHCKTEDECVIDAILLDLILPNSHGIGTFLKVREKVDFVPIVIISAYEDIACKCVELGAQDYLVKPDISPGLLIRSLKYSIYRNTAERKIRNVIMTSSLGYHLYELIDDKLIFIGYNPSSNNILGIDGEQFKGKEIFEAFPDLDPEIEKRYRIALKGHPLVNQRIECKKKDGKKVILKVSAYKASENFLTVTFEDITKKIKTEEALNNTLEEYKQLVEVTGASVFGLDFVNKKFTYVNDVMCKTLGYSRKELLQMWPTDFLTAKSKRKFNERINALNRGEYIHNNVEYECITKSGEIIWTLVTTNYSEVGKPMTTANAVAINITENKKTQQALEKKELEVFSQLEKRIHDWKQELLLKNMEKENQLQLIDAEIKLLADSGNKGYYK